MIIYKVTNSINDKIYVGKTTKSLEERMKHHFCHKKSNTVFHRAINKYGKESFKYEVLERCKIAEELSEREKYWIKYYNSILPNGYNMTVGGEGTQEYILNEARKKINKIISQKLKEKYKNGFSPKGMKGKHHTIEARQKMSLAQKNKPRRWSSEDKKRISEQQKGRIPWNKNLTKETDERIKKSSEKINKFNNPEFAKLASEKAILRYKNPEEKIKTSESVKLAMSKPKIKEKQRQGYKNWLKNHSMSDETKLKISKSVKNYWLTKKQ
jgi:group I intron endonuclease